VLGVALLTRIRLAAERTAAVALRDGGPGHRVTPSSALRSAENSGEAVLQ
jgi:hypothetical protein